MKVARYGKFSVAAARGDAVSIIRIACACSVNVPLSELFSVSLTVIPKDTGPACVGAPLNTPPGLNESHDGRPVADHV